MNTLKVDFVPKEVTGGWTVIRRVGSKKTGRTEEILIPGVPYTLAQAQAYAAVLRRDIARYGD